MTEKDKFKISTYYKEYLRKLRKVFWPKSPSNIDLENREKLDEMIPSWKKDKLPWDWFSRVFRKRSGPYTTITVSGCPEKPGEGTIILEMTSDNFVCFHQAYNRETGRTTFMIQDLGPDDPMQAGKGHLNEKQEKEAAIKKKLDECRERFKARIASESKENRQNLRSFLDTFNKFPEKPDENLVLSKKEKDF